MAISGKCFYREWPDLFCFKKIVVLPFKDYKELN